jgi:peroxiredoxin
MRPRAIALLLSLAIVAGCAGGPTTGTQRLKAGDVAPNFTLPTLDGAGEVYLARIFQDNPATVIIVWSMACPTCRDALAQCEQVYRQYGSKGVAFLGVNFDIENIQGVRAFLKAEDVTFTGLWDPRTRLARGYRAADYTFSIFVVGRDWVLKWVQYDHPPDLAAQLSRAIDKALDEDRAGKPRD